MFRRIWKEEYNEKWIEVYSIQWWKKVYKKLLTSHVWEAAEQTGKEEIENDKIANEDGGEEVGDARRPRNVHAVPHGFYPFPTKYPEHYHKAVHKVCKVPPR